MKLKRLIYASRPFGFDDLALVGILASARSNNARDDITGALICREDLYLQMLEGPEEAVDAAFARIARDDRHTGVSLLLDEDADDRLFPDWAMKHDPAQSWMWTPQQVREDAIASASEDEVRNVFRRIV